jgi:predicted nucleotidyltransferase
MANKSPDIPERDLIRRIAERHGARNVRIIGSVARGDARPDSDLDLLVEVGPQTSPWFPGGLVAELEEALGRPVDVVTERGLAAGLRDQVLAEAIEI